MAKVFYDELSALDVTASDIFCAMITGGRVQDPTEAIKRSFDMAALLLKERERRLDLDDEE
jgi:hypothetical protein